MVKKLKSSKTSKKQSVRSMTGYGKASSRSHDLTIDVEIKTLNNRHLDIAARLPRDYFDCELKFREIATASFKRGRIDIQVTRNYNAKRNSTVKFNQPLYEKISKVFVAQAKKHKVLEEEFMQEALIEILSRKDVLEIVEEDSVNLEKEKKILFTLLSKALFQVDQSRQKEGARLLTDIRNRNDILKKCVREIKKLSAASYKKNKENLQAKISALVEGGIDNDRLEQEVALLVMRSDITEELVRLDSHLETFLKESASIDGKKLEFMLQEILREFNTIGSKSSEVKITELVVEAKTQIERIREQSQNIE